MAVSGITENGFLVFDNLYDEIGRRVVVVNKLIETGEIIFAISAGETITLDKWFSMQENPRDKVEIINY
jgi:hypothetical protein